MVSILLNFHARVTSNQQYNMLHASSENLIKFLLFACLLLLWQRCFASDGFSLCIFIQCICKTDAMNSELILKHLFEQIYIFLPWEDDTVTWLFDAFEFFWNLSMKRQKTLEKIDFVNIELMTTLSFPFRLKNIVKNWPTSFVKNQNKTKFGEFVECDNNNHYLAS